MIRRLHITGGPGGGKTTLAACLSRELDLPVYDLDGLMLAAESLHEGDSSATTGALAGEMPVLAASDAWISDGAYVTWTRPFLATAERIVWLDIPWRVAAYRILARHVRAEFARNNRFPGWQQLARFWLWSRRYYANRNLHEPNEWGTPNTRACLAEALAPYRDRLVVCRSPADVAALIEELRP